MILLTQRGQLSAVVSHVRVYLPDFNTSTQRLVRLLRRVIAIYKNIHKNYDLLCNCVRAVE